MRLSTRRSTLLSLVLTTALGPVLTAAEGDEAPRPLTKRGVENLVAFTHLYGVVRYFHPSSGARMVDWDRFAIDGVRAVEPAADAWELEEVLGELFLDIAPSVQVWAGGVDEAPDAIEIEESPTRRVGWRHVGLGPQLAMPSQKNPPPNVYASERVVEPYAAPESRIAPPGSEYLAPIGGGVSCRVPITLPADDEGTLPRCFEMPEPDPAETPGPMDRATRLASVIITWNIVEHFYPYLELVDVDWPAALPDGLREAAPAAQPQDFVKALSRFFARIHDGHGNVLPLTMAAQAQWSLPIHARFLGERLVVLHVLDEVADRVHPGDEILALDGRPIDEVYAETAAGICAATPGWARYKSVLLIFEGRDPGPVEITLRHPAGQRRRVTVERVSRARAPTRAPRPANGTRLAPGILYFDLHATETAELEKHLPALAKAEGIVFDLRGYPGSAGVELFSHLSDEVLHSAWWNTPIYLYPDQKSVTFRRSHWTIEPKRPRLTENIAFLTNERAISYAESCMGIVEHDRLGEIVGARTAGTNGNINRATLPAGIALIWTGMKVTKPDDSPHHGVGIAPTVPVMPTPEGIAAGRDEELEKAVELLSARVGR